MAQRYHNAPFALKLEWRQNQGAHSRFYADRSVFETAEATATIAFDPSCRSTAYADTLRVDARVVRPQTLGTMDDLYCLLEPQVGSEGRSGDPDNLNEKRASWADAAIEAFQRQTRTDRKDALMDILCDLMHWAVREDFDFDAELGKARGHFAYETGDPMAPK